MAHTTDQHPVAFRLLRQQKIPSLKVELFEYEHEATGARHVHLACPQKENVFMVVLRTVPEDSKGVAHILEHTALCGSKQYPVRDPFFMMLRRSLSTFMNAFTGSDWTAYPFATQNRKDFDNLLKVYLDAVFFPCLDSLDFAQEGHRLDFSQDDKNKSNLQYCGVVYNEMKGAMSAIPSQLWQSICAELYPTTTYKHNSGGDPENIPELSHQELIDFHRRHYHPSNATFMSYGDIPAAQHQHQFEQRVLRHFGRGDTNIIVPVEKSFEKSKQTETFYAADKRDIQTGHHDYLLLSWLLNDGVDYKATLATHLMSGVLLNHSASPLRQLLETTPLGRAPSSLTGLMDEHRQLVMVCGLEGAQAQDADQFETAVLDLLKDISNKGIDQSEIESVLHQYELQHREISGGGLPYGLGLLLQCLSAVLYHADVIAALDIDLAIKQLRLDLKDKNYIGKQIQRYLLDNPHRLLLIAKPDSNKNDQAQASEQERLQHIQDNINKKEQNNIISLNKKLKQRQQQQDDADILPKLHLSDVPSDIEYTNPEQPKNKQTAVTLYKQPTNGIAYLNITLDAPQLNAAQMALLPLYTNIISEVGIADHDYLQVQKRQTAISGGVGCSHWVNARVDKSQSLGSYFNYNVKGLSRNFDQQCNLVKDMIDGARFDEQQRIRELFDKITARSIEHLTQSGHQLAMLAAAASINPLAAFSHCSDGLAGVRQLKEWNQSLDDKKDLETMCQSLASIHQNIKTSSARLMLIAEEQVLTDHAKTAKDYWADSIQTTAIDASIPCSTIANKQLWRVQTQINFCARVWPTVPYTHKDAPILMVLASFLRNGYLHRSIREQGGAYGGGAMQNNKQNYFACYSYRDPRLEETLNDFDSCCEWLHNTQHAQRHLEEAILSVISGLDKPLSPAGNAMQDYQNRLYGYTHELRREYRETVLQCTSNDLLRVAKSYLQPKHAATAVICPPDKGDALLAAGYELNELGPKSGNKTQVA